MLMHFTAVRSPQDTSQLPCPAMPNGESATRPREAVSFVQGHENNSAGPTKPFLSPREVLLCAIRPWKIPRPECTLKTLSNQGGEDAFVHHVCIVFPFRREGTCQ